MHTIAPRALQRRINRKLAPTGKMLVKNRPAYWTEGQPQHPSTGAYCVIDTTRSSVEQVDVDLVALGQELGVLGADEAVTS